MSILKEKKISIQHFVDTENNTSKLFEAEAPPS